MGEGLLSTGEKKQLQVHVYTQGRSQELEMGGAKLLGEGSGGRLRPPVGPGQSPVSGARGAKPPPPPPPRGLKI